MHFLQRFTKVLFFLNKIALYIYLTVGSLYGVWLITFSSILENTPLFLGLIAILLIGPAIGGFSLIFGMALTPQNFNPLYFETYITSEFINLFIPNLALFFWVLIFINLLFAIMVYVISLIKK